MEELWGHGFVTLGTPPTQQAFLQCWYKVGDEQQNSRLEILESADDTTDVDDVNRPDPIKTLVSIKDVTQADYDKNGALCIDWKDGEQSRRSISVKFETTGHDLMIAVTDLMEKCGVPIIREADAVYQVQVMPTDISKRNSLTGQYDLVLSKYGLALRSPGGTVVAYWAVWNIRRYASNKNIFHFESGRRSSTGNGIWKLQTEQTEDIFKERAKASVNLTQLSERIKGHRANAEHKGTSGIRDGVYETLNMGGIASGKRKVYATLRESLQGPVHTESTSDDHGDFDINDDYLLPQ